MADFKPDEKLWLFTTGKRRGKGGPRTPKPKRYFYCAGCKAAKEIKTDKTNLTCKLHGCIMVHLGTGEEAERKAYDLQRAGQRAMRDR